MGGLLGVNVLKFLNEEQLKRVSMIITLNSPMVSHPLPLQIEFINIYEDIHQVLTNKKYINIKLVSFSSGSHDLLVHENLVDL